MVTYQHRAGFQFSETLHDFTNPDDLMFRIYPSAGSFAWTTDNVLISTADGQTYEGDEYKITPDSNYSINNVFYAVSPTSRVFWRSQVVTSGAVPEQKIALKLDPDTSVHINESLPNDILGIHIAGHNFIEAEVQYYSGGSGPLSIRSTQRSHRKQSQRGEHSEDILPHRINRTLNTTS